MKTLLLTVSDADALDDEDSPQGQAFKWVDLEDPIIPQLVPGTSSNRAAAGDDAQIIQRYTLAVMYFSLNGASWINNTGWLGGTTECDWYGIKCSTTTNFDLNLNDNQLIGNSNTPPAPELLDELNNINFGNGELDDCDCVFTSSS